MIELISYSKLKTLINSLPLVGVFFRENNLLLKFLIAHHSRYLNEYIFEGGDVSSLIDGNVFAL